VNEAGFPLLSNGGMRSRAEFSKQWLCRALCWAHLKKKIAFSTSKTSFQFNFDLKKLYFTPYNITESNI
jgi:hypothetical protein